MTTSSHTYVASALLARTDAYGDLLVCILLDKFPVDLRKSLARQHDQEEWTLDQLRAAIKSEIRVLEWANHNDVQDQIDGYCSQHVC